jgi:hypothetical protein
MKRSLASEHYTLECSQMKRLIQSALTFVRGIANENEQPFPKLGTWSNVVFSGTTIVTSLSSAHWILGHHNPLMAPLLIAPTLIGQAGVYTLYHIGIHHGAGHDNASRNRSVNQVLADCTSIVILSISREAYKSIHAPHHIPEMLATKNDPDYKWLYRWGFIPGQGLDYYWHQMWLTLFSPIYHGVFFYKRLKMVFIDPPNGRKALAIAWWSLVFGLAACFNAWPTLVFGYLIPVVIAYQVSSLLQGLSEHRWLHSGDPEDKTFPRYLPIELPKSVNLFSWLTFILIFLTYLWYRTAVIPTDLPTHHQHHLKPRNRNFMMAAYSKEAQRDRPKAVFGVRNHLREAFLSLSLAKSEEDYQR